MDDSIRDHLLHISEQLDDVKKSVVKISDALYDNTDNRQIGLITHVHEMRPKIETFSNYLMAQRDLNKTYGMIAKWVGGVIATTGTIVTIISILKT